MVRLLPIGWKVFNCVFIVERNIMTSTYYPLRHIYWYLNTEHQQLLILFWIYKMAKWVTINNICFPFLPRLHLSQKGARPSIVSSGIVVCFIPIYPFDQYLPIWQFFTPPPSPWESRGSWTSPYIGLNRCY